MLPPASWASTGNNQSWRPAGAWSSPADFHKAYQSLARIDGVDPLWCWAQYAEPGIMRNSTAGVARVACRGGDRADAGAGKFRIIAAG
jgi:hypothetical protein